MSQDSTSQPFPDISFFNAVAATRDLAPLPDFPTSTELALQSGSKAASGEIDHVSANGNAVNDEPFDANFDWDKYNRDFAESLHEKLKDTPQSQKISAIAGGQVWSARNLPLGAVTFLLGAAPPQTLWNYLSSDNHKELMKVATRGFQRTPHIVRQPVVRARLLQWLGKNRAEIYFFVMMWGFSEPPIVACAATLPEADAAEIRLKLPAIVKKFGMNETFAALAMTSKPRALLLLTQMVQDSQQFARLVEESDESCLDESVSQDSELETNTANDAEGACESEPDSEAARVWRTRFETTEAERAETSAMLEKVLDVHEKSLAQLSAQDTVLRAFEKREKIGGALLEKRFGATQKRLELELEELKKNFERQGRKFRALEREKVELDLQNRRFKKQLRHAGILLEEERKKVAALESKTQKTTAGSPVEALSTPSSRQSAPDKPVVVQAPTPLDEIFEWRADKRAVRITPRAVRRLIDKNDEEGVFAVVQALESLQFTDASMHGKFFKRIGDGENYYVRVLKENMARVLVDASNVARHAPNKYGKGQLRFLLGMREELRRLGCFPIVFIADASLRHVIDENRKFNEMVERGEIEVVDKGIEADEILAREARRTGAYVVTNDAKFFHKVSPDFEPPRVTFRIYDGVVIVDDF